MWLATAVNISLLRANPQDLPTSTIPTVVAVVLYYVVDIITALAWTSFEYAAVAAAVDTLLLGALTYSTLKLRRHGERFLQTLTALAGCGAILGIVTTAFSAVVPGGASSLYVSLPALFWLLAVYGHILRHALEVPYMAGIAATAIYLFLSLIVVSPLLVPVVTTAN